MKSGILSSLFQDNSADRSSSLLNSPQPRFNYDLNLNRSKSINRHRITDYSGSNKNIPLVRMNLMLIRKIRLLKQGVFCRLQNVGKNIILDKHRNNSSVKKMLVDKPILQPEFRCQQFTTEDIETNINHANSETQDEKGGIQKIQVGLENLNEVCTVFRVKYYLPKLIQTGFNSIKLFSTRKLACQRIENVLSKYQPPSNTKYALQKISSLEKMVLKCEIMESSIMNIIKPFIKDCWKLIKNFENRQKKNLLTISQEEPSELESTRALNYETPQKTSTTFPTRQSNSRVQKKQNKRFNNDFNTQEDEMKQFYSQAESDLPQRKIVLNQNNPIIKITTKVHSHRARIPKIVATPIMTSLNSNEDEIISLQSTAKNQKTMNKTIRLYGVDLLQQIPDMHDHLGVFQSVELHKQNLSIVPTSYMSSDSYENSKMTEFSCNKTLEPMKITEENEEEINTQSNGPSISEKYETQIKSNPLHNIEEMMLELEKLEHKEKYLKYSSNKTNLYPRCKISVNLLNRYQKSSSKGQSKHKSSSKQSTEHPGECFSEKKKSRRDLLGRFQTSRTSNMKENIEVKLWQEKKKNFFCPSQKRYSNMQNKKKHSSGCISTAQASMVTTARKMKKQIEGIINSRKNRNSIGSLKFTGMKN